jgi:hypothetical protein
MRLTILPCKRRSFGLGADYALANPFDYRALTLNTLIQTIGLIHPNAGRGTVQLQNANTTDVARGCPERLVNNLDTIRAGRILSGRRDPVRNSRSSRRRVRGWLAGESCDVGTERHRCSAAPADARICSAVRWRAAMLPAFSEVCACAAIGKAWSPSPRSGPCNVHWGCGHRNAAWTIAETSCRGILSERAHGAPEAAYHRQAPPSRESHCPSHRTIRRRDLEVWDPRAISWTPR